ncbi:unnamed protein product [Zymoseptoria tritici ST99CH_1A5]|uniref:Uncharacterized protein n=3 Tax=Zymoseptoria tritici TaxID=1047171 RepID=A0A1X7RBR9_ZYMT9|nr:unnamed protein product [Zymoseptoria tritici ST99CH_3D7]SMR41227.1 unnamed protein product [Zymoseptoria tritici ST99CH_1E4]SMR43426.1 unnamed protein product [Zymoseptoria tritici ST99CH_3D1]SMY18572.1 unnamed protein product [Zymoseptoria tritici ST99CH_1A5]
MAGVQDPAFWKRFSTAAHLDLEQQHQAQQQTRKNRPDDWLSRQKAKRSRRTCICWTFWLCFFAFVAGVVVLVIWLLNSGVLGGKGGSGGGAGIGA